MRPAVAMWNRCALGPSILQSQCALMRIISVHPWCASREWAFHRFRLEPKLEVFSIRIEVDYGRGTTCSILRWIAVGVALHVALRALILFKNKITLPRTPGQLTMMHSSVRYIQSRWKLTSQCTMGVTMSRTTTIVPSTGVQSPEQLTNTSGK